MKKQKIRIGTNLGSFTAEIEPPIMLTKIVKAAQKKYGKDASIRIAGWSPLDPGEKNDKAPRIK